MHGQPSLSFLSISPITQSLLVKLCHNIALLASRLVPVIRFTYPLFAIVGLLLIKMPTTKKSSTTVPISKVTKSGASPSRSSEAPSSQSEDKKNSKTHKRSRSGCFTCRLRRKKCDEGHPACGACLNLSVRCEYKRPVWWGNADQRRVQKERIKNKIKQTKTIERSGTRAGK